MNDTVKNEDIEELLKGAEGLLAGKAEPTSQRTVLEIWQEILSNIENFENEDLGPEEVLALLAGRPSLKVEEIWEYLKRYYGLLKEYRGALDEEIASDPDCLKHHGDADLEENRHHYLNMLLLWNLLAQHVGDEWSWHNSAPLAKAYALVDARAFVLGENGLVAHLGVLGLQLDEDERQNIETALNERSNGE